MAYPRKGRYTCAREFSFLKTLRKEENQLILFLLVVDEGNHGIYLINFYILQTLRGQGFESYCFL